MLSVQTEIIGLPTKKKKRSRSRSPFLPHGICTNELGHILIADENNRGINILDKDDGFLTMLTISAEPHRPPN